MSTPTLEQLATAYVLAKDEEHRVTTLRRELAARIQALTGHTAEGQKTYDGGEWKVVVKAPLITAMDWKKWESVKEQIPENLHPTRWKPELDEKGVKWLQNNEPDVYAILATALTVKPGAVQVTVTPKE